MSNYTKTTNFATKDNLSPGNPLKIVKGAEIDTEYNNIATAVATKTDNASAAITGGSITGITDLAVADGGTGASTAAGALNNLLPSQTSAANKYLQSDGTNASWDAVSLSTADITGTLPVANGGTGVTSSTGTGSVVLSNSPTLVTPALGTPASGTATNLTGLPISTGVSGLGTGVATFLGTPSSANLASAVTDETGSGALVFANSPTLVTPALGTPSALVGTNITGTASGLTAGNVTTNANLTGAITSTGNATSLGSFSSANLLGALTDETGSGSAVFATSPTLVTPILGTPTSATLTNATGLPISTGVSGLGTGVATALAVNVGSSGAPLVNGGVLGTPSSGTATNLTGLPLSTGVTGQLPVANGGTGTATPSIVAGTNVTVTGTWPNQTIAASGGGGTPGGSTTQVQYNNAGAFGGITGATSNGTALTLTGAILNGTIGATTPATGAFTTLSASGTTTLSGNQIISVTDNTNAALRVTQLGTGNAILVEDSANPDSTPFVVTADGRVLAGHTTSLAQQGITAQIQNNGTSAGQGGGTVSNTYWQNNSTSSALLLNKSRSATPGSFTIVQSGDGLGIVAFGGDDGTAIIRGAAITAEVDGTPGTNDMPGRLVFSTTADGASSPTERVRIASTGAIGLSGANYGTNGQVLTSGGSSATPTWTTVSGGGSPGGSTTQLQYNNAGAFGGISGVTTDGTRMTASTTIGVGGATPSTSGSGITFPATASASTSANTLDDYEEGTWTPAIGGTATYNVQSGQYVKIGNMVYFVFQLNILVKGTGNNYTVTGLPFNALVNIRGNIQYFETIATSIVSMAGFIGSGNTQFDIYSATAASTNPSNNTIFQNGAVVYGTGFYQT
jgi:hypothetical protein